MVELWPLKKRDDGGGKGREAKEGRSGEVHGFYDTERSTRHACGGDT